MERRDGETDWKRNNIYTSTITARRPRFFVSPAGYGIFVDTCAYSTFRENHLGQSFFSEAADMADFYFIMGENLDEVIGGYHRLTGDAPMLPKWFFGYIQSKEHYHTQTELLEIVAEYCRRKVPLDLIVQDWKYWKEDVWSDKSFDPARYPDPAGMCEEVHRRNARIMILVWANAKGGENRKELWENNRLLGDGEVYNAFVPKAGEVYRKQLQEGIFRHGFDAWWCDCSEPYETAWGDSELTDEERRAVAVHFLENI